MNGEPKSTPTKKRLNLPVLLLVVITLTGFTIRAAYIEKTVINTPIRADARQYVIYALNLINHQTFSVEYPSDNPKPDSFRSPGYSAFISLALLISGEKYYQAIQYSQVVLSTLMVPMTFFLGLTFLPVWASLVSSLLVALSPHLVSSTSYVLTETLFGFVFLAALLTYTLAVNSGRVWIFTFSGILFGYGYLINETLLFLPWILVILTLYLTGSSEDNSFYKRIFSSPLLKGSVILLIVFSIFTASWFIRNHITVPPGSMSGKQRALNTLAAGTYPGFIYKDLRYKYFPYREDPEFPKYKKSFSNFTKIFYSRFKERPARYISWYLLEKPYYLWSWNILQGERDIYIYPVKRSLYRSSSLANSTRIFMKVLHPVSLILALAGFFLTLWQWKKRIKPYSGFSHLQIYIPILYFTLLYTVFIPLPRYSIPFKTIFYLAVMWTLTALIDLRAKKHQH